MISILEKQDCCGCNACVQRCPKRCIVMQEDDEGFLYPHVDESLCIDCGLCDKICPMLNGDEPQEPQQVLAVKNHNEEERMKSSSGGVFIALAKQTLAKGGVVFGAVFDEKWEVKHTWAETLEGVYPMMGSKYLQSRIEDSFKDAERFLKQGREVLFTGSPCQIAGLRKFLRKDYENLLAVDFICHGVPSPGVWRRYLNEIIQHTQHISNVEFRNKQLGWKNFSFHLRYNEKDKTISILSPFKENPFMTAFLRDIILRPSCYACKHKGGRSLSDITIADFWGIDSVLPEMDDDKGTSLVFLNTLKGLEYIAPLEMQTAEVSYEQVKPLNPACYRSVEEHPRRAEFFSRLDRLNLQDLIEVCTRPTQRQRHTAIILRCKWLIKKAIGHGGG